MRGSAISIQTAHLDEFADALRIDDDATALYATGGVVLDLTNQIPFVIDEQARWRRSVELGRLFFAVDAEGRRVGFAAMDLLDGAPYLDQLSVRMSAMRRGIGRRLLHHAIGWAQERGDVLWLTTYGHLPWNRPFYEREGFVVIPEPACSPGVVHHLEEQRRWLPAPEQRVAMRRQGPLAAGLSAADAGPRRGCT
jgi:GNAT superfamily N-acetyltransferase